MVVTPRCRHTQSTCQPLAAKTPTGTVQTVLMVGEGPKRSEQEGADRWYWLRANDFVGSPDRPMNNVEEPESRFKGPKQAAWSYGAARRQAHAAASIHHVNIARLAVFANDRHESDSDRRETHCASHLSNRDNAGEGALH
jgi:hypothetical protein